MSIATALHFTLDADFYMKSCAIAPVIFPAVSACFFRPKKSILPKRTTSQQLRFSFLRQKLKFHFIYIFLSLDIFKLFCDKMNGKNQNSYKCSPISTQNYGWFLKKRSFSPPRQAYRIGSQWLSADLVTPYYKFPKNGVLQVQILSQSKFRPRSFFRMT